MKKYIKLIRVKHWLKNGLIFLPLFFSKNLFDKEKFIYCIIGFLIFSFISSIVYILNDINDIESDRKHEIKKNRPLASGAVSIKRAITISIGLLILSQLGMLYFYSINNNYLIFIIPVLYLIINILYSKSLKHKPILDVVVIVVGFLLRTIYGGVIIDIAVSKWLYLMIIFGSFYLGFGKRRNEIIKSGQKSRKVLQFYNKEFLDKNMYVCLTLAMVSYILWCVDRDTILRIGHDLMYWTVPILMIIFQLYSLNIEGNSHGDPIEVILNDKYLIFIITIYILLIMTLIYVV